MTLPESPPLVSVILPVFNGGDYLVTAVKSIIHQTYTHWELIIIDDGSTDNAIKNLASVIDSRIRILSDGLNKGLASRLNEAVKIATGVYIARMDADDVCFPTRLAEQVEFLDTHPTIDLVGCRAVVFKSAEKIIGLLPFRDSHAQLCAQPWRNIPLPHPTWMGRRHWFSAHPYRLPEVRRAEDQELLLRCYPASTFACIDKVLLGYRQGPFKLWRTVTARNSLLIAQLKLFKHRGEGRHAILATLAYFIKTAVDFTSAIPGCERLFFLRMSEPVPLLIQQQLQQYLHYQNSH